RVPAGAAGRRGDGVVKQLDEPTRGGEGFTLAFPEDRGGDAAGETLVAVGGEDAGDVAVRVPVEDVRGGRARGRVHPHVQRRVHAVREPAVDLIQLHRGDAEVEQRPGQALLAGQRNGGGVDVEPGVRLEAGGAVGGDAEHRGEAVEAGLHTGE